MLPNPLSHFYCQVSVLLRTGDAGTGVSCSQLFSHPITEVLNLLVEVKKITFKLEIEMVTLMYIGLLEYNLFCFSV